MQAGSGDYRDKRHGNRDTNKDCTEYKDINGGFTRESETNRTPDERNGFFKYTY